MILSDLCKYDKILIQCHDNPDADSLASGYGLYCYFQKKGKSVRLVYSGRRKINKSNLRLMIEELKLPVEYVTADSCDVTGADSLLITVDCQYGSGNVTGIKAENVAVIDHHQLEKKAHSMSIINPNLGSCSTLVWKLLKEEGFAIEEHEYLGTALYYGLYMDTAQFSELYNPLDMDMREDVTSDKSLITRFRNANLTLEELEIAGIALIRYSFNDDYRFAVIKAQPCDPNILGLISDFLLQVDVIDCCVVFNEVNDGYKFSVRSCVKEVNASELAGYLAEGIGSGGGHYEKAGGFVSMRLYEENYPTLHAEAYFNQRMTRYFDSYELIYAASYEPAPTDMTRYVKRKLPQAFVKVADLLPEGTPITLRTLEGDKDMTVTEDLYIMLDVKGNANSVHQKNFEEAYRVLEDTQKWRDSLHKIDYAPLIKNRNSGKDLRLTEFAHNCIPTEEVTVMARSLDKGVKVFAAEEDGRYMRGEPGDYLVIRCDNQQEIYIVEKELFLKSYEKLS
ncbi:MAG: bifunctional oligoribonuclease/PAP phosphatase NrnA [Acetatifactor sp.]